MARSGDVDLVWNQPNMDRVLRDPGIVSQTEAIAQRAAAAARASAPVESGAYRDGIRVVRRESRYRTVFRVLASDSKSRLIESKRGILARVAKGLRK